VTVAVPATILLILISAGSSPQESIYERLQAATVLQSRIADLHAQVVSSPDDRNILTALLEAGLQYYELGIRSRFPDTLRNEILELKIAVQETNCGDQSVAGSQTPRCSRQSARNGFG
jgi:hypothetical protein